MDKETELTYKEEEYTRETRPYVAYFQALREVFDFTTISSVADLGCNNGSLLETIKKNHPNIELIGYDYFDWAKKYADPSIKEYINIEDLSKPLTFKKKYDFVNCSEVGEHIPKECEDIFLKNIIDISSDILVLTWSNEADDNDGQHLNPQPKRNIISKMEKNGFIHWKECSAKLASILTNKLDGIGYNWWPKNIMVFKKSRFINIDSSYLIQGITTDNGSHKKNLLQKGLTKISLQENFLKICEKIHTYTANKKGLTILRASDGDYFFLRQIAIGSAKPGRRALTTSYDKIDIDMFRKMFWQNDVITLNLEKREHRDWMKFIIIDFVEKVATKILGRLPRQPENEKVAYVIDILLNPLTIFGIIPTFVAYIYSFKKGNIYFKKASTIINNDIIPSEAIYATVSTKWIFKNFKNQISIIAGENKLALIQELMKYPEYREYIGTDKFIDYISVPEKGAANDVITLNTSIGEKIKNSDAKIFLVGAGSSKIALLPLLHHYNNAVFIDVGCGIDAIAGIVCQDRPYFAEWTNYRLTNYDYSKIDFMDQGNPAWDNPNYKTIKLK